MQFRLFLFFYFYFYFSEFCSTHVEGGMYISPEFQLGQVYDGTIIDEESVLLYRPVYVRVAQKHGDSIVKSVSKHSKEPRDHHQNTATATANPLIHGSPSNASNATDNAVTASSSAASGGIGGGPSASTSAPASRRTKNLHPNELSLHTDNDGSITKVQQVVVDLHEVKVNSHGNLHHASRQETTSYSKKLS